MGKRKVLNESHLKELVLPGEGQFLGKVNKLLGGDNVLVRCADSKTRMCRIRGKMKRRMWIRENDVVLIAPWDFDNKRQHGYLQGGLQHHRPANGGGTWFHESQVDGIDSQGVMGSCGSIG